MAGPPPAQPTAILRGHRGQVNAAAFVRLQDGPSPGPSSMTADSRLATGDSDGYVVLWDLTIVRPRAVWRAHENSILGLAGWDADSQIVTHGRDHKLIVWQVGVADEARLSTELPLDGESISRTASQTQEGDAAARPRPWIVHVLQVNTMNFCAFTWCGYAGTSAVAPVARTPMPADSPSSQSAERLIAVPNTLTLEAVDIWHLPSQRRINTVKLGAKEGMIMAVALFYARAAPTTLVLIAAFENGVAVVATLDGTSADGPPTILYRANPHSQPVLSLDVAPDQSYFLTSAADAVIAKHPIPLPRTSSRGQQTVPQTAATATPPQPDATKSPQKPMSLLSAALAKEPASYIKPATSLPKVEPETQPLKVFDTKHAGQQGLRIRGDGRIFATAGWDSRVRVYSAKTMKELAVLKWHQQGCFAVAFAPVAGDEQGPTDPGTVDGDTQPPTTASAAMSAAMSSSGSLMKARGSREVSVKERRLRHAVMAHWLAVGSKDSKLSLWDIF
ncbi:wd repeat-containing protein [Ophiostoma piceae UAMH 11346]|uniref:ASTRA-associated protein 1 n=1 Tax=Ophiostoma piceae (strain UAMH 11346) TaxID=1262450 RepID=S3CVK4_OPHP1|nr:wd repeat-containing protein [Ophiostoma piceae UAMH 11346]